MLRTSFMPTLNSTSSLKVGMKDAVKCSVRMTPISNTQHYVVLHCGRKML